MSPKSPRSGSAPTIADVARRSGFSPMTVSRVVNGDTQVKDSTRRAVQAAIELLGYTPNLAARSLAGVRQPRIALVYANPSAAYLSRLLVGSLKAARAEHCQLVLEQIDANNPLPALAALLESEIDALVLPPPLCDAAAVLDLLGKTDKPVALIANGKVESDMLVVRIDDFAAAQTMTTHLITLGHRRIGFIGGPADQRASEERLRGYRAALAAAGLHEDPALIVPGEFTFRSGLVAAETLLELAEPPTAIFASNDDMAAGAVTVAHRRHRDVPRDLTVAGFDDTDFALSIWPELTTIHQPIAEMAAEAVRLAIAAHRSGGARAPFDHVLGHALIRRSSDCSPARL
jgi:LacI family transcriptional regulator